MTILFVILIIIASVVLGFIVLVQNPKGGGLAGNIAGFSNQFMGVKQTNDVLERGTWIFGGVVAVLCLVSVFFISKTSPASGPDRTQDATGATIPATQQQQTAPGTMQLTPQPAATQPDSTK